MTQDRRPKTRCYGLRAVGPLWVCRPVFLKMLEKEVNHSEDYCHTVPWSPCHSWIVSICQGVPSGGQCSTTIVGAAASQTSQKFISKILGFVRCESRSALNIRRGNIMVKVKAALQRLACWAGEKDVRTLLRK